MTSRRTAWRERIAIPIVGLSTGLFIVLWSEGMLPSLRCNSESGWYCGSGVCERDKWKCRERAGECVQSTSAYCTQVSRTETMCFSLYVECQRASVGEACHERR